MSSGSVKVEPAKEAPKEDDPAVQSAIGEAARRRQKQRGYRSTILHKSTEENGTNPELKESFGS